MKIPNELLVQLDGQKPFNDMTKEEQTREVKWCLERCEVNREEYPENKRYYSQQIRALKLLLIKIQD